MEIAKRFIVDDGKGGGDWRGGGPLRHGEAYDRSDVHRVSVGYSAFNASLVAVIPALEELSVIDPLLENLLPILEAESKSAVVRPLRDDKIESDVLSGALEVRNLTFSYGAGTPEVLKDISFRISAGEHVATVGKSGYGKSTLIRLLLGFESPKSGAVYYDGQDLADLSLPSVRSQMGVVLQNGQLMTGDILHNIIGTNDLTLDDALSAVEAAGIADDIREMPMQMQTIVSEGSTNISGGQHQRILIARVLAMKPSIIICDEATSARQPHAGNRDGEPRKALGDAHRGGAPSLDDPPRRPHHRAKRGAHRGKRHVRRAGGAGAASSRGL